MLVTAIALFFSTFSTPILSAALTFGFFVAGHFSADLRNFEQVVDSPTARAAGAARSTTCCRTWRRSTSRRRSCTGSRCRPATSRSRCAYAALYIGDAAGRRRCSSSRGATSSDVNGADHPSSVAAVLALVAVLMAGAARVAGGARAAVPDARAGRRDALPAARADAAPARRSRTTRSPPTSTGSARSSTTAARSACWHRAAGRRRHPPVAVDRRAAVRSAVPAARHHDDARSAVQHRVPVRRDLPGRSRIPAGPAGPTSPSRCSRKGSASGRTSGSTCRTSGSSTTGGSTTTRRRPRGSSARADVPGAPCWLRPLAATTLAQGGDRRSSRLMWEPILQTAEVDWLRQQAEHRLLQLDALDQIDALQRAVDRFVASPGHPPLDWAALVRARMLPGRAARSDRHAVRHPGRQGHRRAHVHAAPAADRAR